jgi:hypothetical protein
MTAASSMTLLYGSNKILVPVHAMKTYGGGGSITPRFKLGNRGR